MSTGTRNNKALIFLVVILLLSNIGLLLYFLLWKKPSHKPSGPPKGEFSIVDFMKKEIGFNDEQTKQFQQLHELNRDSLKTIGDSIRSSKNVLYKLMQQSSHASDSAVNAAIRTLSIYQQRMEVNMFRHFERVRAICNPEQQVKLDSMVVRMNNRVPGGRRGGSPRTEGEKKK
jgi:Spy/CpxP family protein refolding chaperone